MAAKHETRIKRLKRLEGRVSPPGTGPSACLSAQQLLELLGKDYGESGEKARLRLIQLDLTALISEGRIEKANTGCKPLVYRRCGVDEDETPRLWRHTVEQIKDLVPKLVKERQLSRLWERLLNDVDGPVLDARRLRVIPDSLRLQPVELDTHVLMEVLNALASNEALDIVYTNLRDERSNPRIHPQALVLRGPVPYLLALKNEEDEPLRSYALHRMIRATHLQGIAAREAEDFDLDEANEDGRLAFGNGDWIDLELLARGYVAELLRACPLAENQVFFGEPDGAEFEIRVTASVPSTGQLLRWLLAAGEKVKVIEPLDLRQAVASQATKVAGLYAIPSGAAPDGQSTASVASQAQSAAHTRQTKQ